MKRIILFLLIICALIIVAYNNTVRFSSSKWISNEDGRLPVVEDLLSKHNLTGMSKVEIIELLGMPSQTYPLYSAERVQKYTPNESGNNNYYDLPSENISIYKLNSKVEHYEGYALLIKYNEIGNVEDYAVVSFVS
jgi:hypothetical protein